MIKEDCRYCMELIMGLCNGCVKSEICDVCQEKEGV
jgi:hypothetical protein